MLGLLSVCLNVRACLCNQLACCRCATAAHVYALLVRVAPPTPCSRSGDVPCIASLLTRTHMHTYMQYAHLMCMFAHTLVARAATRSVWRGQSTEQLQHDCEPAPDQTSCNCHIMSLC